PTFSPNYIKLRSFLTSDLNPNNSIELDLEGLKVIMAARYREIVGEDESAKMGSLFLLHDITQKLGKQRLKEEFISVLSHELKTPLQSLSTASDLLERQKSKVDESLRILVETVYEDVARIRAIANDFMQVGQDQFHSLKLNLKRMPLSRLLEDWIKPFRGLAQDRGLGVEYVHVVGEVWAMIDEIKFPWVVSNLLSNAIRVTKEGRGVRLELRSQGNLVAIDVVDEGPGIAPEIRERMFEPFFQG